jgi:hypothetical protein
VEKKRTSSPHNFFRFGRFPLSLNLQTNERSKPHPIACSTGE